MMRIEFLCLLLPIFLAAKSDSSDSTTKKYLDLDDNEDNVILWKSLFAKINTILGETTRVRESQNEFSESLLKLNKRQDTQELKLTNFLENTEKHYTDLKKGQDAQERKWNHFMKLYFYNNNNEWITILRRQDGSVNFYRNWTEYQKGFGNSDGEFFIGLEKLHALTTLGAPQELMVIVKDFGNETRVAKYDLFQIGNESEKYALKEVGTYSGDAGDSLSAHKGMMFSTYDQDNDRYVEHNCAEAWKGAWWFDKCYRSHLFGLYRSEKNATHYGVGWNEWKREYSFKFAEMKIRSISF